MFSSKMYNGKMCFKLNTSIKTYFNLLIKTLLVAVIVAVTFCNQAAGQTDGIVETNTSLNLLPLKADSVGDENDLSIYQIITNVSMFNDESNVYDKSVLLLFENITRSCLQNCIKEEFSFLNEFGLKCKVDYNRPECYRARCFKGCELWWRALKEFEPCQEACSSMQFYPFDLPCISACETAQRLYWHFQRLHVERLLKTKATTSTSFQPQLLHDNETLNTLTLKWPITMAATTFLPSLYLASTPFYIQYQYVLKAVASSASSSSPSVSTVNDTPDINSNEGRQQFKQNGEGLEDEKSSLLQSRQQDEAVGYDNGVADDHHSLDDVRETAEQQQQQQQQQEWWNLADYNCNENFECDIMDGLMPFTSYKFRFVLPFGNNLNDVLYSAPSEIYTTPAMGTPVSKPLIRQALALDDTHIAVFWQPGKFTNGPLTNYKLILKQLKTENQTEKTLQDFVPSNVTYKMYFNLSPTTTYNIRLSMLNREGEGPWSEINVTTKAVKSFGDSLDDFNTLIVGGEYSIVMKSLDPLVESRVLLKSEEILTDFDAHQYTKQLFVLDKKGVVKSFFLDDASNFTQLHLPEEKSSSFVPSKLAVDWLNQKLYLAGLASPKNSWLVKRLDFNGSSIETVFENLEPLKQLQVDALNGWLFASTEAHELCRLDLHSFRVEHFKISFDLELFSNQQQNFFLTAFNSKERSIYEVTYDAIFSEQKLWQISANFQGDILWFQVYQHELIMSNGSHLLRQNLLSGEADILAFKEVEWCWKLIPLMSAPLKSLIQPLPKPVKEPVGLQAILSANKAKISWQAPLLLQPFQSKVAWHNWEYELDILDVSSNNAFNIRSIKSTYFQVERLQAHNLYKIRVRALFAGWARQGIKLPASEWSQELTTRTWPMGNYQFLWATTKGLWGSQQLLKTPEWRALQQLSIKSFKQINSTIFYIEEKTLDLKCYNLMQPEVVCSFKASNVYSMDYDWRGAKLYWSDISRNCIIRADLKGEHKELLPLFGARLIKLDSTKGYIYFTTDNRLLRRQLNGAMAGQELEYYHSNENGEQLEGFTLDFSSQQIYWWVQLQEGDTRLFCSDMDFVKPQYLLNMPEHFRLLKDSFDFIADIESFIWLEKTTAQIILASKENMAQLTLMDNPLTDQIHLNSLQLKRDYTNGEDLIVIPEAVDKGSVHITEGYWDDFNIKWSAPSSNENFTVFYRVLISTWPQNAQHILSFEVVEPIVRITEFKLAGSPLNVTITPSSLWFRGPTVTVQLQTPSTAPKQPKNLRVFVEQFVEPLEDHNNITALVRWDSPDNISLEKEIFYKIYCWHKEDLHGVRDVEDLGLKSHEVRFYNLQKADSYMFQVQAFSLSRAKGGEKSSILTHFVNPEAQAVPKLLYTTPDYIGEFDMDLNVTKHLVFTASAVEHLALISSEQRIFWVNENVELMSYQPGAPALKLARMRAEVLGLTVDWILRKVYWAEMSGERNNLLDIYELDLNLFEGKVMLGSKIFSLAPGKLLKDLLILPYSRALIWLEHETDALNSTLQGRNLTDYTPLKLRNQQFYTNMFEGSLQAEMETVNLVDLKGKMFSFELQRQLLTNLKIPLSEEEALAKFQRDAGYIYSLCNKTLKAYHRRKHILEFKHSLKEVKLIKAFNYQEYPKRECLIMESLQVEESVPYNLAQLLVQQVNEQNILLNLVQTNSFGNCKLPIPGLRYKILVKDNLSYEREFQLPAGQLNITDLKPYTNYSLEISASSFYQQKFSLPEMQNPLIFVRTDEGTPTQPLNFTAQALSPTEISVSWLPPLELNADNVSYQLYWQALNSSLTSHKLVADFQISLTHLEPAQEYLIWLEVYAKPTKLNSTQKLAMKTFPLPEPLQLMEKAAYNLTLSWQPNMEYESIVLECQPLMQELENKAFSIDITDATDNITVTNLEPKTKYEFYFKLKYATVERPYIWPETPSGYYVYETLGDAPGRPGQPQIEHITGEIFKVFWEAAVDNGAPIIEYGLEALKSRHHKRIRRQTPIQPTNAITTMAQLPWVEELKPIEDKWISYCNTSELSCIVRELHTMRLLMFRVRARNEPYGWGPYSEESERVLEPFVSPQKRNSLVFAIIAPAAIVTTCVIILFVIRKVQKRRLKAKELLAKSRPSIWSNFSSVQQQFAARNRAFSMASSLTMYTGGPLSDADIALLPHINWSQITLLNFLGSGAFGEVYEGMLKYADQDEMEKVAIKSLRKGASEFAELLQEAQLMSNFKHENIVRLIGVCCDTESISIIMEHMEGGDLLSYLRESRPNSKRPVATLQLLDLMSMCIDVATGMAYLEDMHFVHRDLACRNCLVSSREPSKRTVKIGDFGLARDIYKSDYYRKEGEALMPVRWMALESLVDGVFTTQSDVWAFGVLCWEILTLGQQPYAGRNNFEVLHFVKEGGRLEQPDNCPDKLFNLMKACWQIDPNERPSFRKCLNTLLNIKTDVRRVSLGYNLGEKESNTYANQHGIVLSSFLTTPSVKKVSVEEENAVAKESPNQKYEIKQNSLNDEKYEKNCTSSDKQRKVKNPAALDYKPDVKVRFNNNVSMMQVQDRDSCHDDQSHLIDTKLYRIQENPDYYINEAISKL